MKIFTVLLAVLSIFCISLSVSASEWNIYASVNSPPQVAPGEKNPGSGLIKISQDGKVQNLSLDNLSVAAAEVYPDGNKDLMYAATHDGLFVSKNNGAHWRYTTDHTVTEVNELVVDPRNSSVVYFGTSYGLFKATEFGEKYAQLTDRYVSALLLDLSNPNTVFVGQDNGLFISKDAGKTFTKVLSYYVNSLAQDPKNFDRMYLGSEDNGIFISTDHGQTWKNCEGIAAKGAVYKFAIDNKSPNIVYAATCDQGILITADGGKTWTSNKKGLESCFAIYSVIISPDNANTLFAATTDGIYKSTDAGKSWTHFALKNSHVFNIEIKQCLNVVLL